MCFFFFVLPLKDSLELKVGYWKLSKASVKLPQNVFPFFPKMTDRKISQIIYHRRPQVLFKNFKTKEVKIQDKTVGHYYHIIWELMIYISWFVDEFLPLQNAMKWLQRWMDVKQRRWSGINEEMISKVFTLKAEQKSSTFIEREFHYYSEDHILLYLIKEILTQYGGFFWLQQKL